MVRLGKMGHIWENGSHLEKWVTIGKTVSHLVKWVTFEKWIKIGKMGQDWLNV